MRDRSIALAFALLALHCAWSTRGTHAAITIASDDPPGPRMVLDARGREHVLDRAVLHVDAIALVACPGTDVGALLAPGIARAHHDGRGALGPIALDLLADEPSTGLIDVLPGRYCDIRIAVSAIEIETGGRGLRAAIAREVVLRIPEASLDAAGDAASITIVTDTAGLLARADWEDADADATAALSAAVRALRVE